MSLPFLQFLTGKKMLRSSQLLRNGIRGMRNARMPITQLKSTPFMPMRAQLYSTKANNEPPKLRFLFYMFVFASGVLYLTGNQIDKRKPKNSFTEKEFEEYESSSGLKRRSKLIPTQDAEKYRFFVVPYVHQNEFITKIAQKLGDKEVRVIDPEELIKREREDESRHYSYLLQDLAKEDKPLPKGLVTALIKDDIKFYLNTRNGTFDTNFLIKNYPQSTDEAIKFENDISDILKCIVLHYDMLNELKKNKGEENARLINNVVGYYETVNKAKIITAKHDELDDKLQEISLEFI